MGLKRVDLLYLKQRAQKRGCTYSCKNGIFEAYKDGKTVIHVNSETKTGYCLFGENAKGGARYNSGFQKQEIRLKGYDIEDRFNYYNVYHKRVGEILSKEVDGVLVNIPVITSTAEQNGLIIYNIGDLDFSAYEYGKRSFISEEIMRQDPSIHMDEHWKQVGGKLPGYTAHHNGPKTLCSIPTRIHQAFNHAGWSALMNETKYIDGGDVLLHTPFKHVSYIKLWLRWKPLVYTTGLIILLLLIIWVISHCAIFTHKQNIHIEIPTQTTGQKPSSKPAVSSKYYKISNAAFFNFNQDNIENFRSDIDSLVIICESNSTLKMIIHGYTCDIGSEEYNQNLSERRAENVQKMIITRYPFMQNRIDIIGWGENAPDSLKFANKAQNRRVDIELKY